MKRVIKQILLVFLILTALSVIIVLCSCNDDEIENESAIPTDGLLYTLNNDNETYSVSGIGTAVDTDIIIAATYNNKPVTSIAKAAFHGCHNLTSVTIPDTVETIGESAFFNCSGLAGITIPAGVTTIGENAFKNCGRLATVYWDAIDGINMGSNTSSIFDGCIRFETVVIGTNVRSISKYSFNNCTSLKKVYWNATECINAGADNYIYSLFGTCFALESVVIGENVTTIPSRAFDKCINLTSITIPKSVKSIGGGAFVYCSNLTDVYYTGDIAGWCDINFESGFAYEWSYSHNLYIDNELVSGNLIIPDTVKNIGAYAFSDCTNITSVTIGNAATVIGACAFQNCRNLKSLIIGNSVMVIERNAFVFCGNLTDIIMSQSVTTIGESAFSMCGDHKTIYYKGTASDWERITKGAYNSDLIKALYFYSENQPTGVGNYWHLVDGVITIWKKDN